MSNQNNAALKLDGLSAKALKQFLVSQNISIKDCIEKKDFLKKAKNVSEENVSLARVRGDIEALIHDQSHDDGSYAPLLIRFAWHNCGTYDKSNNTGGSNGATMRFQPEKNDPENSGLSKAISLLSPIVEKYPWLSTADIWILAGYVAIESTGGPPIPFCIGRKDFTEEEAKELYGDMLCPFGDGKLNPNTSRLPSADLGSDLNVPSACPMYIKEKATIDHVRSTFSRMGFSDKETVCLIIFGHQYGRCHLENSGYEHPWYAFGPTEYNVYAHGLGYMSVYNFGVARGQFKEVRTSKGKRQYNLQVGWGQEPFMMLPSDMALWWCPKYQEHVKFYDANRIQFRKDAAAAWKKLTELGCPSLIREANKDYESWWGGR